jgi:hypothetical protein
MAPLLDRRRAARTSEGHPGETAATLPVSLRRRWRQHCTILNRVPAAQDGTSGVPVGQFLEPAGQRCSNVSGALLVRGTIMQP